MSHKISRSIGICLIVVGSLLPELASADEIYIPNGSFESPLLDDGKDSAYDVPNWTVHASGTGNDTIATWDPDGASFTGASGEGTPKGGEGQNVVHFIPCAGYFSYIDNQLSTTLQAGTYTLTVAVGNLNGTTGSNFEFGFYTTGTTAGYLASYFGFASELLSGELADKSTTELTVTDANPRLNEPIVIAISGTTAGNCHVAFDNVRLEFTPTPEPSSLILLSTGLLGLLCYAWRRRK